MENKKIKVLVCRPNETPRLEEHEDTLETWQGLVGGYIDLIYPHDDDAGIILNDEGKLENLPLNRPLTDSFGRVYDVIVGTFVIVKAPEDSDEFESLTDEQIQYYSKKYETPLTEESADTLKEFTDPTIYFMPGIQNVPYEW